MKVTENTQTVLKTEESAFFLRVLAIIMFGIFSFFAYLGYESHSLNLKTTALLVLILIMSGLMFLFVPGKKVEFNKTTGKGSVVDTRVIGKKKREFLVTEVDHVYGYASNKYVGAVVQPYGMQYSVVQLILKDETKILLDNAKTQSFVLFGKSKADSELGLAQTVATFLRVPIKS